MQERKTQLENTKQEKLNQAGFATEADLEAQITSLTSKKQIWMQKRKHFFSRSRHLPHRKKSC